MAYATYGTCGTWHTQTKGNDMETERVEHMIEPVFDERSKVLLLGTMPSPASRKEGFFYGHPQNRFWRVLAAAFDEPVPENEEDKRDLLLRRGIALWDVLASCDIEGASDASIRNARPNDLSRILDAADIRAVFTTGTKAGQLYAKLCEKKYGVACTILPSTSPANAKMRMGDLVDAYREALLPLLPKKVPPTLDVVRVVALEQAISAAGTPLSALMRRAGRSLAKSALDHLESKGEAPAGDGRRKPIVAVLCGFGNNGGDGWVAAESLAAAGCEVRVVTPCPAESIKAEPARGAALRATDSLTDCESGNGNGCDTHGETKPLGAHRKRRHTTICVNPNEEESSAILEGADVIIDAMLGTGFSGDAVREPFATWIRKTNEARHTGSRVIAADVPSGLSAQTGKAADPCIKADLTLTMMTLKPGLVTPYAFAFCGDVRVAPIAYIDPFLERVSENESKENTRSASHPVEGNAGIHGMEDAAARKGDSVKSTGSAKRMPNSEFYRAEAEDDDGYDPYSDRRPEPEPMFQRDPWV